jgi:hypothetical protein
MTSPGQYFSDKREAKLADAIWHVADTLPATWKLRSAAEVFGKLDLPWMNKKILYAANWTTWHRELENLNSKLNSDYSDKEIGDVEHFYVAALAGTIGGPTGGFMLNIIACPAWELVVGPTRVAWSTKDPTKVWQNIKYNWHQLTGPDAAGARFGSLFYLTELKDALSKTPAKR